MVCSVITFEPEIECTHLTVAAEVHLDDFHVRAECEGLGTAGLPLEGVQGPVQVSSACNKDVKFD